MTLARICPLVRAIGEMLPGAICVSRREREWHSATFSGSRIRLGWEIPDWLEPALLEKFRAALPEQNFVLAKGFVADIAILEDARRVDGKLMLDIEALVLDD